jgi:hypothetical protein
MLIYQRKRYFLAGFNFLRYGIVQKTAGLFHIMLDRDWGIFFFNAVLFETFVDGYEIWIGDNFLMFEVSSQYRTMELVISYHSNDP